MVFMEDLNLNTCEPHVNPLPPEIANSWYVGMFCVVKKTGLVRRVAERRNRGTIINGEKSFGRKLDKRPRAVLYAG
jgi:hypothetical protein